MEVTRAVNVPLGTAGRLGSERLVPISIDRRLIIVAVLGVRARVRSLLLLLRAELLLRPVVITAFMIAMSQGLLDLIEFIFKLMEEIHRDGSSNASVFAVSENMGTAGLHCSASLVAGSGEGIQLKEAPREQ